MIMVDYMMNLVLIFSLIVSWKRMKVFKKGNISISDHPTEIENASNSDVLSLTHCIPPTILRSLQSTYRYHPGEQLHFLVEYKSSTDQCHCLWQVQRSHDRLPRSIEHGLIVNADYSSILIIESITSEQQGLYTFHVENIYGRAMTQTIVIVNTNDLDDDVQSKEKIHIQLFVTLIFCIEYQEIGEEHNGYHANRLHHRSLHEISSSVSSEYEDVKVQSSTEEISYAVVNLSLNKLNSIK